MSEAQVINNVFHDDHEVCNRQIARLVRKVTEWRQSAMLWKGRATEAEEALARLRRTIDLNRGNRTAPYAGTSNYVSIADLEDALGEHVRPTSGPREDPTSAREDQW